MYNSYYDVIENHNIFACQLINFDINHLKLNKSIFSVLQKVAPYFGYELKYDEKSGIELIETNLDNLLSTLSSENTMQISELIKKCLITEQLVDKLSYMSQIAIKMSKYLAKNNNIYKNYFINNNIFIEKYYNCLSRENNGYFRHDSEDSGDKEKTKEWNEFDDNTKIKIINEKIIIYSFILAMIENIDKDTK